MFKELLIGILMVLSMVLCPLNTYAEKSDNKIAQELLYGQWAIYRSDVVKYNLNDSNVVDIYDIEQVDPYDKSKFWCTLRVNGKKYLVQATITLEGNRYWLKLNFTGTAYEMKNLDPSYYKNKFVKVYWD